MTHDCVSIVDAGNVRDNGRKCSLTLERHFQCYYNRKVIQVNDRALMHGCSATTMLSCAVIIHRFTFPTPPFNHHPPSKLSASHYTGFFHLTNMWLTCAKPATSTFVPCAMCASLYLTTLQNAAACLILGLRVREHVTPARCQLVHQRNQHKLFTMECTGYQDVIRPWTSVHSATAAHSHGTLCLQHVT